MQFWHGRRSYPFPLSIPTRFYFSRIQCLSSKALMLPLFSFNYKSIQEVVRDAWVGCRRIFMWIERAQPQEAKSKPEPQQKLYMLEANPLLPWRMANCGARNQRTAVVLMISDVDLKACLHDSDRPFRTAYKTTASTRLESVGYQWDTDAT